MEHELYEIMSARRSCRQYTGEHLPTEKLQWVLDAGRMAPSGSDVQRCHFVVARREKLEELRQCVEQELAALDLEDLEHASSKHAVEAARKGNYQFFYGAPVLVVVANHLDNYNALADTAAAMQNMMLMATHLGLGNCWINQLRRVGNPPALHRLLGLEDGEAPYAALALGYPAKPLPQKPLPRNGNRVDYLNYDDEFEYLV